MVWLATNACNARCQHCSSNSSRRTADELTTCEVLDMVDQLADAGIVDMAVSGGEPLLRVDLPAILRHVRRRGIAVGVGTNGSLLTADRAARLRDCGVGRVQISLDGGEAAHDRLRCWPGLFRRATTAIGVSIAAGLRTHVCCTINRFNADQLPALVAFVRDLGVARINLSRYVPTGRDSQGLDLTPLEWRAVVARSQALRDQYRGVIEIVSHLAQQTLVDADLECMPGFVGCQAGIGQGCITASGDVYPCVLLPITVGNLRAGSFADLWRGAPLLRRLRDRSNLGGGCCNCVHRDRCGGCRAVAYAHTGDPFASDPRCWLRSEITATSVRHPMMKGQEP